MFRRIVVAGLVLACLPVASAAADTSTTAPGDIGSTDATTALAALGLTPAQFEATSGGVSLAQLQEQLADMNAGLPIPNFAASQAGPTTALGATLSSALSPTDPPDSDASVAPDAQPPDSCGAVGSNKYTPVINTLGLRGYARLGFLETCNVPRGSISSSCTLTATAGSHTSSNNNARGGINCSTSAVVGPNRRGKKGTYSASWGAYNKLQPFAALPGCIADGQSAFCVYKTSFTVGHNNKSFNLTPTG